MQPLILNDTYPDKAKREQHVYLYEVATGKRPRPICIRCPSTPASGAATRNSAFSPDGGHGRRLGCTPEADSPSTRHFPSWSNPMRALAIAALALRAAAAVRGQRLEPAIPGAKAVRSCFGLAKLQLAEHHDRIRA
ncbi:MAG: hypothetical protein R2748_17400 [Bryobacterales bacterium]